MHTYFQIYPFQKTCQVYINYKEKKEIEPMILLLPAEIIFPYFSGTSEARYWFRIRFLVYISSRSAEDRGVNIIRYRKKFSPSFFSFKIRKINAYISRKIAIINNKCKLTLMKIQ